MLLRLQLCSAAAFGESRNERWYPQGARIASQHADHDQLHLALFVSSVLKGYHTTLDHRVTGTRKHLCFFHLESLAILWKQFSLFAWHSAPAACS